MGKRLTKTKLGDVFEVVLRDCQLAYLQVVHAQSGADLSDVVRVLEGRYSAPPEDLGRIVAEQHEYLMFASPRLLMADGYARLAGNWPIPSGASWSGMRYALMFDRNQTVQAWILSSGRVAIERSPAPPPLVRRRDTPVWQLGPSLNTVDILMASREGSLEAGELDAWRLAHRVAGPRPLIVGDEAGVRHFALFPAGADLRGVTTELSKLNLECSTFARPEILDGLLLIITARGDIQGSVNEQWDRVESIVRASGGEYDGWESATAEG